MSSCYSKTEIVANEGSFMHQISEKLIRSLSEYEPPICCFPTWINTIARSYIQNNIKVDYTREILKTVDGGLVAIDWANINSENNLIVLIIPGNVGTSKSNYVTHLVQEAVKAGCSSVSYNYRGYEVELTTAFGYCPGFYDDLHMVVKHIHKNYPLHKIFAVGVSLGGIILGGYLAREKYDCLISNAMIAKNMDEIDKLYMKYCGYISLENYYQDGCLVHKIEEIKVPTLFLNAVDDMLSPETDIPIAEIKKNLYTALIKTKYGGHNGYSETVFPKDCTYVCRMLRKYIQIQLENNYNDQLIVGTLTNL